MIISYLYSSPCRIEHNLPNINWSNIWLRAAQSKALSWDATSFSFKMLHDLLPTEYRLSTILRNGLPTLKFSCQGEGKARRICNLVQNVSRWLYSVIESQLGSEPSSVDIISLNLNLSDGATWVVVNTLLCCWNQRRMGRRMLCLPCCWFENNAWNEAPKYCSCGTWNYNSELLVNQG